MFRFEIDEIKSHLFHLPSLLLVVYFRFQLISLGFWLTVKKIVVFVFLVSFGRVFLIQLQYLKVFCVSRIKKGKG